MAELKMHGARLETFLRLSAIFCPRQQGDQPRGCPVLTIIIIQHREPTAIRILSTRPLNRTMIHANSQNTSHRRQLFLPPSAHLRNRHLQVIAWCLGPSFRGERRHFAGIKLNRHKTFCGEHNHLHINLLRSLNSPLLQLSLKCPSILPFILFRLPARRWACSWGMLHLDIQD